MHRVEAAVIRGDAYCTQAQPIPMTDMPPAKAWPWRFNERSGFVAAAPGAQPATRRRPGLPADPSFAQTTPLAFCQGSAVGLNMMGLDLAPFGIESRRTRSIRRNSGRRPEPSADLDLLRSHQPRASPRGDEF